MNDLALALRPWIHIIGAITVVAALWAARDIALPIVLAALLSFLLSGPVRWFEKRIGRVAAVLGVVSLGFATIFVALWVVTWQLDGLIRNLPRYRQTLVTKVVQLRNVGKGGAVEELQKTIEDVKEGLSAPAPGTPRRRPTVVLTERLESGEVAFPWLGSLVGYVTQAGVVVTLVIFMLLERRDLRDRVIRLIGHGHVALTTKALDEAGSRVARHLLMQSAVNGIYGVAAAAGLWYLGVPYPYLWAVLGAALRFIPYLGPVLGAGAPIVVSIAATPGWSVPLQVMGMYALLELFTNLVLETVLYAGAAGVSHVGLLLSVTFWTWLWGPAGLLVATPLTVVMVVMGKHVRGFEVLATLLADHTALTPAQGCYQRLLARDTAEAAELVERFQAGDRTPAVFDDVLLPALVYLEADRLDDRVSADEEARVIGCVRELVEEAGAEAPAVEAPVRVLGWAANGAADEVALEMLARVVHDLPIEITMASRMLPSEILTAVREEGVAAVCIADLPPRSPSRTRYLLRRLRAQDSTMRIIVGRWGPAATEAGADDPIVLAGASHVSTTLADTRRYLQTLVAGAAMTGNGNGKASA